MRRLFTFPVGASAVLGLALAGCQSSDLLVRYGEEWVSFDEEFQAVWERDTPGLLSVCASQGAEQRAVDAASTLCARILFDEARLAELRVPATLTVDGTAVVPTSSFQPSERLVPAWQAGEGSAPAVSAAWVTLDCFGNPVKESVTQQVRGQVLLTANGANVLKGRVVLEMEGEPGGSCGGSSDGAKVDAHFSVSR